MGDFRSYERGDRDEGSRPPRRSFGGRDDRRSGGRSFGGDRGGFGGGRGRSFGGDRGGRMDRRDMAPCDAVCAKCGKNCKVPFKPTGDKPVYCSECFGAGAGGDRGRDRGRSESSSGSGITADQFQQLNKKLDKILEVLSALEIIPGDDEESEDEAEEEVEEEAVEEAVEKAEDDTVEAEE